VQVPKLIFIGNTADDEKCISFTKTLARERFSGFIPSKQVKASHKQSKEFRELAQQVKES
jgi:hypothetical protein